MTHDLLIRRFDLAGLEYPALARLTKKLAQQRAFPLDRDVLVSPPASPHTPERCNALLEVARLNAPH